MKYAGSEINFNFIVLPHSKTISLHERTLLGDTTNMKSMHVCILLVICITTVDCCIHLHVSLSLRIFHPYEYSEVLSC